MNKPSALAWAASLLLGLSACGTQHSVNPPPPTTTPPPATCDQKMWEALAVLEASSLPMSFRIGTFSDTGCEPLGLTVAGLTGSAEVENLLADAGIRAQVTVVGPPNLQPTPPQTPGPLRVPAQNRLTGRNGQELAVNVRLTNTGKAAEFTWGEKSYDWELLDAAGHPVSFRGAVMYALPAYRFRCEAGATCTAMLTHLHLNRMNEKLPLPAGNYTLRLQLNDIDMDRQKLDLGVFDLPVTVQP